MPHLMRLPHPVCSLAQAGTYPRAGPLALLSTPWSCLAWPGLVWSGLVWSGLVWRHYWTVGRWRPRASAPLLARGAGRLVTPPPRG
jgi:hypothetical protein